MKKLLTPFIAAIWTSLVVVGCGNSNNVDTSKLDSAFQSAQAGVKSDVEKAISDIKAAKWSDALASLQNVAKQANLTPEQRQVVSDVIAQVQKVLSEQASKAVEDAKKNPPSLK